MSNQKPRTLEEQLSILKNRRMKFHDEQLARTYLTRESYFRMKYFWIDLIDENSDEFKDNVYFEDVIERYEFDKSLREILFNAIETLEVGLRARIISTLSLATGTGLWYLDDSLFENKDYHEDFVLDLKYGLVEAQTRLHVISLVKIPIGKKIHLLVTIPMPG